MITPTTILQKDQILLAGFGFFGDPFRVSEEWTAENEVGRLWMRLLAYMEKRRGDIRHIADQQGYYEVHLMHEETRIKGHYEVFIGLEVSRPDDLPVELLVKILPPSLYAVFTLTGEQIAADWPREIYSDWLPASDYQAAYEYSYQYYDHRFKGLDRLTESSLDVYVPITTK